MYPCLEQTVQSKTTGFDGDGLLRGRVICHRQWVTARTNVARTLVDGGYGSGFAEALPNRPTCFQLSRSIVMVHREISLRNRTLDSNIERPVCLPDDHRRNKLFHELLHANEKINLVDLNGLIEFSSRQACSSFSSVNAR